jgi:single-strand DNA-binding protein
MLNQCLLVGNLGNDPDVYYSSEGNPVASFNLAFHSSKKKLCWIKVTCFHKLAEITEKYLKKGSRVAIVGTLDQQKWETNEGIQRSSFQLICNSMEFIRIKSDGTELKEGESADNDVPF